MIKDFEGIKKAAHSFYKDLYNAPEENPIDVNSYPLDHIPVLMDSRQGFSKPIGQPLKMTC